MDFWNDNTTFVMQENEKCELKKMSIFSQKKSRHQMEKLLLKCIGIIYI